MVVPGTLGTVGAMGGLNVVIASRIYLPEPGAASLRLAALSRTLRNSGATVTVLTSVAPSGYKKPVVDHRNITVRRSWVLRDSMGYVRGYVQYMSFDIPLFFRLLFTRKLDLVVVEPPPTTGLVVAAVCALRHVPFIYYAADLWADALEVTEAPKFIAKFLRWLENFSMSRAAAVLSVSTQVSRRVVELGVKSEPITVGNGVDTTLFSPEGDAFPSAPPYLLYAGTASEVHGAGIFLDAFEQVVASNPQARLVFIGQGADRRELERRVDSFPAGSVRFESRLSPEETAVWIRGARATLASVKPGSYAIGFPTKIYASIACGVPVLYAGEGAGNEFMSLHDIGWSVQYSVGDVVDAMFSAFSKPVTNAESDRLVQIARSEAALSSVAAKAVAAISLSLYPDEHKGGQ